MKFLLMFVECLFCTCAASFCTDVTFWWDCSRKNCSCFTSSVSCTAFCKCMAQDNCQNPHTKHDDDDDVSVDDVTSESDNDNYD